MSQTQRPRKREKLLRFFHLRSSRAVSVSARTVSADQAPGPPHDIDSSTKNPSQSPGLPSPWKMALDGTQIVLSGLERCLDGVPIASNVVGALNVLMDIANDVKDNNEDLSQLCDLVKKRLEILNSKLDATKASNDLQSAAEGFATFLVDKLHALQDIRGMQAWKSVLESSENKALITRSLKDIQEQTVTFQLDISLCVEKNLEGIKDNVERLLLNNWLRSKHAQWNISPTDMDHGSIDHGTCTNGTRHSVLQKIKAWASDPTSSPVFWMDGEGGSGKSTISRTIAHHFDTTRGLPPPITFFCSRKFHDTRQQVYIIPTLVYQLCWQSRAFSSALCQTPTEMAMEVVSKQMEVLFIQPWKEARRSRSQGLPPVLVIVDALDEVAHGGGFKFLAMLLEAVQKQQLLGIKFLITSRPDPHLKKLCGSITADAACELYSIPRAEVEKDILKYLETEMHEVTSDDDNRVLEELARKADGLFIAAATAVRHAKPNSQFTGPEQIQYLKEIVGGWSSHNTGMALVDSMYQQILADLFSVVHDRPDAFHTRRDILHAIVSTEERISVNSLSEMIAHDQEDVKKMQGTISKVLESLHAVLRISRGKIEWYHTSFLEFIFNPSRSNFLYHNQRIELHCSMANQHKFHAHRCFRVMQSSLRFNICGLPSSFIPDNKVKNLEKQVEKCISEGLVYACLYWANHVTSGQYSDEADQDKIEQNLEKFLTSRFMFWIEAMSLLKEASQCGAALHKIQKWLNKEKHGQQLLLDISDAIKLTLSFAAHPPSKYTPHLYISSLAGSSPGSKLLAHWRSQFHGIPSLHFNQTPEVELMSLEGHTGYVTSVAFSQEGQQGVSGSNDMTVRIWDVQSGRQIQILEGHTACVRSVAFSLDGKKIVSGSNDMTVRIWDGQTGREIQKLGGHNCSVTSVAFSPHDQHIVSGSDDNSVRIWDRHSGREIQRLEGHTSWVMAVAFSPDGQQIVSGSNDHTVRIWDGQSGRENQKLAGHTSRVTSVAFSPDGQHIVSGSSDKSVRIWDSHSGKEAQRLEGHTSWVTSVTFSPDGLQIVSGSDDKSVRIWDRQSGREIQRLEGHTDYIKSVALSPDGQQIMSGSHDRSVKIWDRQSGRDFQRLNGHADNVRSVAFSPDGHHVVSGSDDKTVRIWDRYSANEIQRLEGHTSWITSVAFSPDGQQVVSGSDDRTVRIWNIGSGMEIERLEGHSSWVTSVAFSPDGHQIVSGSSDKTVRIWDKQSGREVQMLEGHTSWVTSVAFSPDGQQIISGSDDKSVRIWDKQSGRQLQIFEDHSDYVTSVAFSPDNQHIVSGSHDKTIRIWDRLSGREVQRLEGHTDGVRSVAIFSDGQHIVSGSLDRTVRIWDTQSGTESQKLEGHTDGIKSVALSPQGQQLVSGSSDKTVRIWDIHSFGKLEMLETHTAEIISVVSSDHHTAGAQDGQPHFQIPLQNDPHIPVTPAMHLPYEFPKHELPWCVGQDSWLVSPIGFAPLLWLPRHLHPGLYTPSTSQIISNNGTTKVSFTGSKLGVHWAECYTPHFD